MNFTLIDYTAFGLWVLISIFISYVLINRLKFFKGDKNIQKVLTWGLILGHLLYLIWKYIFLKILGN
jgi:membrane protein DedA with SNARE-associated domain